MKIIKDSIYNQILVMKTEDRLLSPNTKKIIEDLDLLYENSQTKDLLIDCSSLEYIASAGIGCFLRIRKHLEDRNGIVKICSPNKIVKDALLLMGLDRLFEIHSDINEARENLIKINQSE